jgi:hypothetical protein
MGSAFGWTVAIFAGFWLFLAARGIARDVRRGGSTKLLIGVMGLLVLIGAGGFFGAALSAMGLLKLPTYYEWPAGYVNGVVRMPDGRYVVPLVPSGRVQIYDSQWHFIRGWNVEAQGGEFRVECSSKEIEVVTARGEHRYSFTDDGKLISTSSLSEPYYSLPKTGESVNVPTSPLLWVFSSPFLSMGLAVIGFVGIALVKKLAHGQNVERDENEVIRQPGKMNILIYPFLLLALVGLVVVLSVHVAALAGSTALLSHVGKLIFPGIFVVWLPTIVVMNRLTRDFKQKDIWKAALRGCPQWMQRAQYIFFGYAFIVAFVLPFVYGGGMDSPSNSARAMSAIALTFYSIATCVLYSATKADRFDESRRCANGHPVTPLAKHCDECGALVLPATFHSSQSSS